MISNEYKHQLINVLYDSLNLKNLLDITSSFSLNINEITENTEQREENNQTEIPKKPKTKNNLFSNFLYNRSQDDEHIKNIDTEYSAKLQKTIIPKKTKKNNSMVRFSENKVQVVNNTSGDSKAPIIQNKTHIKNSNTPLPLVDVPGTKNSNTPLPLVDVPDTKNSNTPLPLVVDSQQVKINENIIPNTSRISDIKTNINKLLEIPYISSNDNSTTIPNTVVYSPTNPETILPNIENHFTKNSKSTPTMVHKNYDNEKYKDKKIEWIRSTNSDPYSSSYFRPNKNLKSKIKNVLFSSEFVDRDIDTVQRIDKQIENIKTFGDGGFIVPDKYTEIGIGLVGERGPETITKKGSVVQVKPINKTTKNVFSIPKSQEKINEPTIILNKSVDPKQNKLTETNVTQLSNNRSEIKTLKSDIKKIEEKNKNLLSEIEKLKTSKQDKSEEPKEKSKEKDKPKLKYPANIIQKGMDSTEYYSKVFNMG